MEPRQREKGAGTSKQKRTKKNKKETKKKSSCLQCLFWNVLLCFLWGFHDLVIHFSSERPNVSSLHQSLWLLLQSVSRQMASG